jgi:hypothetical protein
VVLDLIFPVDVRWTDLIIVDVVPGAVAMDSLVIIFFSGFYLFYFFKLCMKICYDGHATRKGKLFDRECLKSKIS